MNLDYQLTVAEAAAASGRAHSAARGPRAVRWGFGLATALLVGAASARALGIPAAVAAAFASFLLYHVAARAAQHWYLRRAWRAYAQGGTSIPISVTLEPGCLHVRAAQHAARVPIAHVRRVVRDPKGVRVDADAGMLLFVPARAFPDPATMAAFAAELERPTPAP